jgi:PAS domain S-box-containing protein
MPPPRVPGIKVDAFVQQARDPVFLLGPDRRILFVNRAWEQLTGHLADAVIGQECRPHSPTRPGDLDSLGAGFCPPAEALAGQPSSTLTSIIDANGEHHWRRVEYFPFHTPEGSLIGLLGVVRPAEVEPFAAESDAQRLRVELLQLRERLLERHGFDVLIGQGAEHRRLLDQIAAASSSTVPVLIVGEAGTGKRLVARTIHLRSPRREAPILPFDCQALPPEILERELFGVWANSPDRPVRAPEGATLILSDVLDLPRDLQSRLGAALGSRFRLIATTTGNPEAALQAEQLRSDLYYALTTLVIRLRPLRERLEDIPLLAQHFLERANLRSDRPRHGFTPEALGAITAYDWPGNLRELAQVIVEEAHQHGDHPMIQFDDIPPRIRGARGGAYLPPVQPAAEPIPLKQRLTDFERSLIERALEKAGDNKSKAAKLLGVNRPFLYRRLKELGIADDVETDPTEDPGSI